MDQVLLQLSYDRTFQIFMYFLRGCPYLCHIVVRKTGKILENYGENWFVLITQAPQDLSSTTIIVFGTVM